MPKTVVQNLAWSLAASQARTLLGAIGRETETPVVFLKAAWAEPVLYGNRGERTGCDIDLLVHPGAFRRFARALEDAGYERLRFPTHSATNEAAKAWTFRAPRGGIDFDLHRGLTEPPWFRLDAAACLARAMSYPSPDGPVVSLCPEDQVLYAAAHYASHGYDLANSQLGDLAELLAHFAVNWATVLRRADDSYLSTALGLLVSALVARGVPVPLDTAPQGMLLRARRRWLARFVRIDRRGFGVRRRLANRWHTLLVKPVLSDRPSALPRFLVSYLGLRARDILARLI